jgi:hypothetical protein
MIVGYTNYSNQPRKSYLGLVNLGMYDILCSSIILNGSGWYGTYSIVFVKSNGTEYLYILSGPVITGPCDVPVYEPLEQRKGGLHKVGTPVKVLTGVWVVS